MSLLDRRPYFRPMQYEWAFEAYKQQNAVHWLPNKVTFDSDIIDFKFNLTDAERNLITQIMRFFTQGDVEVQDNYNTRLGQIFRVPEVAMMLSAFANMEAIHVHSYSYLLDTLGLPEADYAAFHSYKSMREKYDYLQGFNVDTPRAIAKTLGVFGGYMEGVALFASFAVLKNFSRMGKLKNVGTIIDWSMRDENLHADNICKLYRVFLGENPGVETAEFRAEMIEAGVHMVQLEDSFIDTCFELGPVDGLTASDLKTYVRYMANRRMHDLGLPEQWPDIGRVVNPLPWLDRMMSGREHTNFFEEKPTAYGKGVLDNDWDFSSL